MEASAGVIRFLDDVCVCGGGETHDDCRPVPGTGNACLVAWRIRVELFMKASRSAGHIFKWPV